MIVLKNLKRTCFACPSQWEGECEDGTILYIRFRFGVLDLWHAPSLNLLFDTPEQMILSASVGPSEASGAMTCQTMMHHVEALMTGVISWPSADNIEDDATEGKLSQCLTEARKVLHKSGGVSPGPKDEGEMDKLLMSPDAVFLTLDKMQAAEVRAKGGRVLLLSMGDVDKGMDHLQTLVKQMQK
jgi:hypothetical protein